MDYSRGESDIKMFRRISIVDEFFFYVSIGVLFVIFHLSLFCYGEIFNLNSNQLIRKVPFCQEKEIKLDVSESSSRINIF